eukprot:GFYU01009512.1.p1 GENE.GFYU01009512.1~~GFYU01009512.1.p1  ORF type:complete len:233 (+),score=61.43 GFYU01009512.1:40-699(+)
MSERWRHDKLTNSRVSFLWVVLCKLGITNVDMAWFEQRVVPLIFLYINHVDANLNRVTHTVYRMFLASGAPAVEQTFPSYFRQLLRLYPNVSSFDSVASGFAAAFKHLPARSPLLVYSVKQLAERVRSLQKLRVPRLLTLLLFRLLDVVDFTILPIVQREVEEVMVEAKKNTRAVLVRLLYGVVSEITDYIRKEELVNWFISKRPNFMASNEGQVTTRL